MKRPRVVACGRVGTAALVTPRGLVQQRRASPTSASISGDVANAARTCAGTVVALGEQLGEHRPGAAGARRPASPAGLVVVADPGVGNGLIGDAVRRVDRVSGTVWRPRERLRPAPVASPREPGQCGSRTSARTTSPDWTGAAAGSGDRTRRGVDRTTSPTPPAPRGSPTTSRHRVPRRRPDAAPHRRARRRQPRGRSLYAAAALGAARKGRSADRRKADRRPDRLPAGAGAGLGPQRPARRLDMNGRTGPSTHIDAVHRRVLRTVAVGPAPLDGDVDDGVLCACP